VTVAASAAVILSKAKDLYGEPFDLRLKFLFSLALWARVRALPIVQGTLYPTGRGRITSEENQ